MAEPKTADTTSQPATTESAPKQADAPVKQVFYTGVASIRTISKEQWEAAGITDQEYVAWTRDSGHKLPKERFTPAALDVLKQQGDEFVIED